MDTPASTKPRRGGPERCGCGNTTLTHEDQEFGQHYCAACARMFLDADKNLPIVRLIRHQPSKTSKKQAA